MIITIENGQTLIENIIMNDKFYLKYTMGHQWSLDFKAMEYFERAFSVQNTFLTTCIYEHNLT